MDVRSLFRKRKPDCTALLQAKNISGLIGALRYPDVAVQKEAAQALGALGPEAVESLIRALKTGDAMVKLGVIEALGKIRDPRAVQPLLSRLQDESNEVRWVTAIALGEIEDPSATGALVTALRDPDKYVRYGAASALTRLGWKPADAAERALYFTGLEEWNVVAGMEESAIPALANALRDRDVDVRLNVLDTLGRIRSAGTEPLVLKALSDGNSDVRWRAVLISQKLGISPVNLPRHLATRPRNKKNPLVAAFLNFTLPGLGYGYLGKWWGIMIFQIDITLTVWLFKFGGEMNTYSILFPLYFLLAIHGYYMAARMPEM
jgi:hypothetical protein